MATRVKASPTAFYLYGVSKPLASRPKLASSGIKGEAVTAVPVAGFWCWVSPVAAAAFAAELERNLENLDWLAEAGLKHQQAVTAIYALPGIALVPARFGAIFSGEKALAAHIRERKPELARVLKHVAGADEWGVKVFVRRRASLGVQAASGAEYLQKKAQAMSAAAHAAPDAETAAFAAALGRVARAAAPAGRMSGAQPDLQWQASFLLPRAQHKKWEGTLRRFATRWGDERSIECTGPWPPYSFTH